MNEEKDWYEHRHELEEGDVFITKDGGKVALTNRVYGARDLWHSMTCINGNWYGSQYYICPTELKTRIERHYG